MLYAIPLPCVAREGLLVSCGILTRGFATLRTLAMIGVAPGGASLMDLVFYYAHTIPMLCDAREGLLGSCGILTRGSATLRTLAMIGVAPGGASL